MQFQRIRLILLTLDLVNGRIRYSVRVLGSIVEFRYLSQDEQTVANLLNWYFRR